MNPSGERGTSGITSFVQQSPVDATILEPETLSSLLDELEDLNAYLKAEPGALRAFENAMTAKNNPKNTSRRWHGAQHLRHEVGYTKG